MCEQGTGVLTEGGVVPYQGSSSIQEMKRIEKMLLLMERKVVWRGKEGEILEMKLKGVVYGGRRGSWGWQGQ